MNEVSRTLDAYESDADAYVAKYLAESIAARYGDAFCDAVDGERLLDVGCGPGSDVETFAAAGYDVTGLDVTPSFLRTGSERVPDASFARGDMRRLPFRDAAFDGVWSSASFLHVPRTDAPATLREFRRVLRAGGVAYVSVKRVERSDHDANGRHFEYYRPDEFRALLADAEFEPLVVETHANWASAVAARE